NPRPAAAGFRGVDEGPRGPGRTARTRRPAAGRSAEAVRTGRGPGPQLPGRAESRRTEGGNPAQGLHRRIQTRVETAPASSPGQPRDIERYRARIEQVLDRHLPPASAVPQRLHEALRYSVLGSGKRLRPILVYATGEALGVALERLDAPAAAVELIHAYSLVHDDLPAMDNDELRRGRPTCHKAFDEATAILAGDALQVLAFELLASGPGLPDNADVRLELVRLLASASGTLGMAGGQALDLAALGNVLTVAEIEQMHARKTGALIHACVLMAATCAAQLSATGRAALDDYGRAIGL